MDRDKTATCPQCGRLNPSGDGQCDCGYSFVTRTGACRACGAFAPTKYVEFHQNIGGFVVRFHKSMKGALCKSCIHRYFWEYTGLTLFAGWWGVISFFVTPVFLVNNVVRYVGCLGMASAPRRHRLPGPAPAAAQAGQRSATSAPPVTEVRCWRCKAALSVAAATRGTEVSCRSCGTKQMLPI